MVKYTIIKNDRIVVTSASTLEKIRTLLNILEVSNKNKQKYEIYKLFE